MVHPAKGHWSGTLANALQFHFAHLSRINGDYRPGIVHRLDRDTSGVILVAKTSNAAAFFSKRLSGRDARKIYWALVVGEPAPPAVNIEHSFIFAGASAPTPLPAALPL